MPQPLPGQAEANRVIRHLTEWPKVNGTRRCRDQPVLVLEGMNGTGKTALLDSLAALLDHRVPYARLNFGANQTATTAELLSALAFQLSRPCAHYPARQFRHLAAGLVILDMDLSPHNQTARAQVAEALSRRRSLDVLRGLLQTAGAMVELVVRAQTGASVQELAGRLPRIAAAGLHQLPWVQRLELGPAGQWYGHRGRGYKTDAVHVLVELNRKAALGKLADGDQYREQVNEVLLDAFLADLREEVGSGHAAKYLNASCVLMLEQVDLEIGKRFLHQLVGARSSRAAGGVLAPEPLTVVAASRGALLAEVTPAHLVEWTGDLDELTRRLDPHAAHPPRWLRYQLPALTEDEVDALVTPLTWTANVTHHQAAELIWRLTDGHPGATRRLVDIVADDPESPCDDLAVLLSGPDRTAQFTAARAERGQPRISVAERLLADLLGDFPEILTTDLITGASAVSSEHAIRLATGDATLADGTPVLSRGEVTYLARINPVLWPDRPGTGSALLHRLLLGKLARRCRDTEPATGPHRRPEWNELFDWHRERCREDEDEANELYYALAVGEVRHVACILLDRLQREPAESWLRLLHSVVRAPYRPHHAGTAEASPHDEVYALTGEIDDLPAAPCSMIRLVAGSQILACPLTSAYRSTVHLQAAVDLEVLAAKCRRGRELIFKEAQKHRRLSLIWP